MSEETRKFEYPVVRIKDIEVVTVDKDHGGKKSRHYKSKNPIQQAYSITIEGTPVIPTRRFWSSLQGRFGFGANIFRYFKHEEVFKRISDVVPNDKIRVCLAHDAGKINLLAATNPNSGIVRYDTLINLLAHNKALDFKYHDGVVQSMHQPHVGGGAYSIAGDGFVNQYAIDTPVDGFGRPSIYLSLLRLVCSNGMVGYTKTFRSEINTTKRDEDVAFALQRVMDGFNNEEGFVAMQERYEAAANSWVSLYESTKLYNLLLGCAQCGQLKKTGRDIVHRTDGTQEVVATALPILQKFNNLVGDLRTAYGVENPGRLSTKLQRKLPGKCSVYQLLNFVSEVATHHTENGGDRKLNAYIGDLISDEYDLEGTKEDFGTWEDFIIQRPEALPKNVGNII